MKCINCDNEAKWISDKYPSPVCSKCARKEVDRLLATGDFDLDNSAVVDFYEPMSVIVFGNRVNFDPKTGEVTEEKK